MSDRPEIDYIEAKRIYELLLEKNPEIGELSETPNSGKIIHLFESMASICHEKHGIKFRLIDEDEAHFISYLENKLDFLDFSNAATWDEENNVVYFNAKLKDDSARFLRNIIHEYDTILVAELYGGKDMIPGIRMDIYAQWLNHFIDEQIIPEWAQK